MRTLSLAALLLLALSPLPARSGDRAPCDDDVPKLRLVLDADDAARAYGASDQRDLRAAGYELLLRARPKQDLRTVRRRLEAGETVYVEADDVSVYDLERLLGLGGAPVAVFRRERSTYDLERLRRAGLALEIRHAEYSAYELRDIAQD